MTRAEPGGCKLQRNQAVSEGRCQGIKLGSKVVGSCMGGAHAFYHGHL